MSKWQTLRTIYFVNIVIAVVFFKCASPSETNFKLRTIFKRLDITVECLFQYEMYNIVFSFVLFQRQSLLHRISIENVASKGTLLISCTFYCKLVQKTATYLNGLTFSKRLAVKLQ